MKKKQEISPPHSSDPAAASVIGIDLAARFQTFEGWGTSLAWWANVIGGWSEERRTEIVEKLYSAEKGLGFNIARYNIGGTKDARDPYLHYGKAILSYQNEDGTWDWSRDAGQRTVTRQIRKIAETPIFEAFSNSPPWWMTCSYDPERKDGADGCTTGGFDGGGNLRSGREREFAEYLTETVKHFRDEWGIVFRTLAPFNEPVADWWKYRIAKQEGAHIGPAQQQAVIREVYEALRAKGLVDTSISASDESLVQMALETWQAFEPETKARIEQVNTHTYNTPDYDPRPFFEAVAADGKKLWMSEFGFENGEHPTVDPYSMTGAQRLVQGITRDLKIMQAEAWVYWQAVESDSSTWGLIFAPFENNESESYAMYKQYYALGHYSRFIRPGSVIIANDGDKSLAAVDPSSRRLVIVTYNDSETEAAVYRYQLRGWNSGHPHSDSQVRVYRTTAEENLAELEPILLEHTEFTAETPPCSITTYVIDLPNRNAELS
ncbi:glycoside hydrolase family 30 protein [Saccharibacillus deserti]|uniref:glycoside hydrolase family 30 protein n=1 Tax=Saccharibacillus deserti TaxID=1634444 RepID=UPI001552EE94|nr:glycoside hydrolase [Saccharibacillus deserti]